MTIREFTESGGKTRPRPRIAVMEKPSGHAVRSAIVTTVYYARELLSDAHRAIDGLRTAAEAAPSFEALTVPRDHVRNAAAMLSGAESMLRGLSASDGIEETEGKARSLDLIERAIVAARSSAHHAQYTLLYRQPLAEHDRRIFSRSIAIWSRSAESAMQETHRVLAELAELMPDAYSISDE